jgi:hypothetical protein
MATTTATLEMTGTFRDPYPELPPQLRHQNLWLVYQMILNEEKTAKAGRPKFDKPPFNPLTGLRANDASMGVSYQVALRALQSSNGLYAGLGFYVRGSGLTVIDIDRCRDPKTGIVAEWAVGIVRELNSYAEVSPSGTGVHIWVIGTKPGDRSRLGAMEIYSASNGDSRYMTVTGMRLNESSMEINQVNLTPLYNRMISGEFSKAASQTERSNVLTMPSSATTIDTTNGGHLITTTVDESRSGEEFRMILDLIDEMPNASAEQLEEAFRAKHVDQYRDKWDSLRSGETWLLYSVRRAMRPRVANLATAPALATDPTAAAAPTVMPTAPEIIDLWEAAMPICMIPDTPLESIIPGIAPKGEVVMMAGDFGSFKTYMAMFIADAISEGGEFASRNAEKHPVLYLDRENSRGTWSQRRHLVGGFRDKKKKAMLKLLGRFTTPPAPELTNPSLLKLCGDVHPYIVVDSMQDFHPGRKENDPDDMTDFVREVAALIDAGAVGVILLHHVPKTGHGRAGQYRGSTAIPGGVGAALHVQKIGRLGVKIEGFKSRDGEDVTVELEMNFPSDEDFKKGKKRVTYKVVEGGLFKSDPVPSAVLQYLENHRGSHSALGISKQVCHNKTAVKTACETLLKNNKIARGTPMQGAAMTYRAIDREIDDGADEEVIGEGEKPVAGTPDNEAEADAQSDMFWDDSEGADDNS